MCKFAGYCGKRLFLFLLLCFVSLAAFSQSVSVPLSALEEIRQEAALIRRESSALKALLSLSEAESTNLKKRLSLVEMELTKSETLLREASLNLAQSEAALIPLQQDLAKLKNELAELKKQAIESNRRLAQSQKQARFWMAAAISVAAAFAVVEIGRGVIK
jgi:chromosome segregation ATPase